MALESEKYPVLDRETAARQNRRSNWREFLHRWLIKCPRCAQAWLAPGVCENDSYICQDCGLQFLKCSTNKANP